MLQLISLLLRRESSNTGGVTAALHSPLTGGTMLLQGYKITKFAKPALGKLDNRLLSRIQESIWDKNAQKIF